MLAIFICILFCACSNQKKSNSEGVNKLIEITEKEASENTTKKDKQDIRELAYNQLTKEDKERISGTWEDSTYSKITLKEGMGTTETDTYIGKEVYIIDFPTKDISLPNNMIVYLEMDNNKLIGYGIVE